MHLPHPIQVMGVNATLTWINLICIPFESWIQNWECLHRYKEPHPSNPHMFLTVPVRKSQFAHKDTPLTSLCKHMRLLDLPSWTQIWNGTSNVSARSCAVTCTISQTYHCVETNFRKRCLATITVRHLFSIRTPTEIAVYSQSHKWYMSIMMWAMNIHNFNLKHQDLWPKRLWTCFFCACDIYTLINCSKTFWIESKVICIVSLLSNAGNMRQGGAQNPMDWGLPPFWQLQGLQG